ncbi:mechanosensitive ion channel [Salipiger sp. 1_MG-2023]|uniref:mechanosensitive ion channel domain-containing protein n=1 Tax=Salipiger sp. 1_MG-2023 TaxID=3062665 RepID=UPI0026E2F6AC|nr:mechanosensitive ion channel domain-containing protein [Salipiger sp. 1_MG-2023]MDO6585084.1 mechanosensitive ion channel [Salipiger sp. 1_MG-2023]
MTTVKTWIASLLILASLMLGILSPSLAAAQDTASETPTQSSLELLLEVIENDDSRAALIDELKAATTAAEPVDDQVVDALADAAGQSEPAEGTSLSRRIAEITQTVAQDIAAGLSTAWDQIARAPAVFDGLQGGEIGVLIEALEQLGLIIVVTVAIFLVLRRIGKRIYARLGARAEAAGAVRTVLLFLTTALIDASIVVISWAAGYLIATMFIGGFGEIGIRQTLYLNAFLLVEMCKVVVRLILSPAAGNLRVMPVSNGAAKYLARRLNFMVGLVGYGQLLAVPIVNASVNYAAGRAVSALVALIVVGFAIWLVLRNRQPVADWLQRGGRRPEDIVQEARLEQAEAQPENTAPDEYTMGTVEPAQKRGAFQTLARHWHWPALMYLAVMLVLVLVQPGDVAFTSLLNSGQVLLVVIAGIALSGAMTRVMINGVQLPETINARMPLLQRRLNTFVPKALFVLRFVIFVAVVAFALDAISLIDLHAWMASRIGVELTGTLFSVAAVLVVAFGIWVALTSWVDYRMNPEYGSVATAREKTLLSLLRNAATIALVIITLMFVLSEIGLDIAPLLASAGVLGLAIGFGAQKLVQDIITGVFIQLENAMNVGDVVNLNSTSGVVEKLTIRSVGLRDVSGAYHLIPFSSVDMVTNYVREFGYAVCDMGVAYRENISDVKQAMLDAFEQLRADPDQAANIMGDLEWFGINAFGDSAVVVRTRIKCVPGSQWGVGRAYNGVLKEVFDARNIEIPFPHQTIFLGEAKDGSTQTVNIRSDAS